MATLTIAPEDLVPALVAALKDPQVREALALDRAAPAPVPRFMSIKEYAKRLGVSARCVRTWIAKGMPASKIGSIVRLEVERADSWVSAGGSVSRAILRTLRSVQGGR